MPIISIIVPVYKVEKYLERCVKSLIHQTLKDIEIILVDDGSPDQCGTICDELRENDARIRVVHKCNGGLSSARNAGMKIAKGKYVGFVDSDDDVELEMFERMVDVAEENVADFVMADYIRLEKEDKIFVTKNLEAGVYRIEDIKRKIYPCLIMDKNIDYGPILSVWCCIYRRDFLSENKIMFAEDIKWSEDNLFNAMVSYCAKCFVYLKNENLYHYYQNEGTITTSYRFGAWDVYKKMNVYMEKYFGTSEEYDFSYQLKLHMIYYACNVIEMECHAAKNLCEAKKIVKLILDDPKLIRAFRKFQFPRDISWKFKIQLWLMRNRFSGFLAIIRRG